MGRKPFFLTAVVGTLLALDIATKRWALAALEPGMTTFWGKLPITLAFNKGAAFSLHVGAASRWFFLIVSVLAIAAFLKIYFDTPTSDRLRLSALATVIAGALGNLVDRVRWDRGVVDFIGPVDLGFYHFPIFNIADIAITCGAVLLAISFWNEKPAPAEAEAAATAAPQP